MAFNSLMVFTGNANPKLAADVASQLNIDLGRANVGRFSDGEVSVELQEHVRGRDIFVLQSTCAPCNDNLMELLVMVDSLKRASAGRITAAIPYFGYARQDRRSRSSRVPIAAKLVANMLVASGVDRVLTMDLHAEQIQGFFDIPVDNIYALPILLDDIMKQNYENPMVVSPDHGGVVRARSLAMDDMVDTAGTLCKAATALKQRGAKQVVAYCTHPVLSGPAIDRVNTSDLDALVVTDTIPLRDDAAHSSRIRQLSVAEIMAETIRRISNDDSVSSLFID